MGGAVGLPTGDSTSDTPDHAILGSPRYIPPEQASGEVNLVDKRSDIYGLGAILFTILTGKPPHTGEDLNHQVA